MWPKQPVLETCNNTALDIAVRLDRPNAQRPCGLAAEASYYELADRRRQIIAIGFHQ